MPSRPLCGSYGMSALVVFIFYMEVLTVSKKLAFVRLRLVLFLRSVLLFCDKNPTLRSSGDFSLLRFILFLYGECISLFIALLANGVSVYNLVIPSYSKSVSPYVLRLVSQLLL